MRAKLQAKISAAGEKSETHTNIMKITLNESQKMKITFYDELSVSR